MTASGLCSPCPRGRSGRGPRGPQWQATPPDGIRDGRPLSQLCEDAGEAERTFRREAERHSGMRGKDGTSCPRLSAQQTPERSGHRALNSVLPTMRSESSGHRGLLQPQFLHSFRQVLVIDLEDNLKAIIRFRKDI